MFSEIQYSFYRASEIPVQARVTSHLLSIVFQSDDTNLVVRVNDNFRLLNHVLDFLGARRKEGVDLVFQLSFLLLEF